MQAYIKYVVIIINRQVYVWYTRVVYLPHNISYFLIRTAAPYESLANVQNKVPPTFLFGSATRTRHGRRSATYCGSDAVPTENLCTTERASLVSLPRYPM